MERKRLEEERRRKEEEEQRSRLEGRLEKIISDLNKNQTNRETTIAGLELGPIRCRILSRALRQNNTLRELHLSRKRIADEEGEELIKSLMDNESLEKLELEGNALSRQTAKAIGAWLSINDSLKFLDLEGNNLYDPDLQGISAIAQGISVNQCLISLNLSNCGLKENCGHLLAKAMQENFTIIHFDLNGNKFTLDQIRSIKECLIRNKEIYDEERMQEWRERKSMKKEEEYIEMVDTTLQQESIKKMNILSREEAGRREKEQKWEEEKLKLEFEMKKDMLRLLNESKKRSEKKKGKKRGKGKKGKK
jgi:hypothetical protein